MHAEAFLAQLAVILGFAVAVVLLVGRVGLPPIAGFLLAGIAVGPDGLGLVADVHQVELLAELGVALLLFTIGLEFSLERLKHIWRHVVLGGGLQVLLTIAVVAAGLVLMGESWKVGVFWGFAGALSSTAIVLRALADRGEINAPHGRFVIAVLIFQDLCIVPMMLIVPMLGGGGGSAGALLFTLGKAVAVVALILVAARRIVPAVLHRVAATRRSELFLLSVLWIGMLVAAGTAALGLSLALGAFLAGVVIADTEFVAQAHTHVAPLRDALASVFFVSIGMLLDPSVVADHAGEVGTLFLILLLGKGALATAAGLLLRFPARVAVIAGAALAQVGEFSFVLLRAGESAGLVSDSGARIFIAASVLSMITTPLLVAASPRLGAAGARLLRPLETLFVPQVHADPTPAKPLRNHVIIAGLGLGGQLLRRALDTVNVPSVVLELNPETVSKERAKGNNVRYGDATSLEVLTHVAEAEHARLLVLLVSDPVATRTAVGVIRAHFPKLHVVVRAHRGARDETELATTGVEVVSEDYETALEIIERVLHRVGPVGASVGDALAVARATRDSSGLRRTDAGALLAATSMDAVPLGAGSWAVDRVVSALGLREHGGALIVAIGRDDTVLATPGAEETLRAGDVVFVFGSRAQAQSARDLLLFGAQRPT